VPGPIAGGAFARDGQQLAVWSSAPSSSAGPAPACRIFTGDGAAVRDTCAGAAVVNAMFVSRGDLLALDIDGAARIWSANDGAEIEKKLAQPGAIGGALVVPGTTPFVLTWSGESWRAWNGVDGTRASSVVRQSRTIVDAQFDDQEHVLRTWDSGGTARAWRLEADEDLPARKARRLFGWFGGSEGDDTGTAGELLKAVSGSYLDENGNVGMLEAASWVAVRQDMVRLLDEHLKEDNCAHARAAERLRDLIRLAGAGH
jgi:hypothetical protein